MERRERHLGRADQVQVVVGRLVDRRAIGREEPGPVHRLLAHQHRRDDRGEARLLQQVDGERHERELQPHHRPEQVDEARARRAGAALQVDDRRRRCRCRRGRGRRSRNCGGEPTVRSSTASSSPPSGAASSAEVRQERAARRRGGSRARGARPPARRAARPSARAPRPRLATHPGRHAWPRRWPWTPDVRSARVCLDLGARLRHSLVELDEASRPSARPRRASAARTRSGSARISRRSSRGCLLRGRGRRLGERRTDAVEVVPEHERATKPVISNTRRRCRCGQMMPSRPPAARARLSRLTSAPEPGRVEQADVRQVDDDLRRAGIDLVRLLPERRRPCRCRARPSSDRTTRSVRWFGADGETHRAMLYHRPENRIRDRLLQAQYELRDVLEVGPGREAGRHRAAAVLDLILDPVLRSGPCPRAWGRPLPAVPPAMWQPWHVPSKNVLPAAIAAASSPPPPPPRVVVAAVVVAAVVVAVVVAAGGGRAADAPPCRPSTYATTLSRSAPLDKVCRHRAADRWRSGCGSRRAVEAAVGEHRPGARLRCHPSAWQPWQVASNVVLPAVASPSPPPGWRPSRWAAGRW